MKQPVLLVMNVPEGADLSKLGPELERELRGLGHDIEWAMPVQRTDGVPAGAVT